jgi:hypothetical protein
VGLDKLITKYTFFQTFGFPSFYSDTIRVVEFGELITKNALSNFFGLLEFIAVYFNAFSLRYEINFTAIIDKSRNKLILFSSLELLNQGTLL